MMTTNQAFEVCGFAKPQEYDEQVTAKHAYLLVQYNPHAEHAWVTPCTSEAVAESIASFDMLQLDFIPIALFERATGKRLNPDTHVVWVRP